MSSSLMDKVLKQLQDLGLTENEAKAYLASLELGPATVMQIGAKSGVGRTTMHTEVGRLVQRGLMSQFKRGKKMYFQAEKPANLVRLIESEKRRISEQEAKFKQTLPILQSLIAMSSDKPEVKYYEGMDGLETMRSILLNSGAKKMDIVASAQYEKTVSDESVVLHDYRLGKTGINVRDIFFSDSIKQKYLKKKIENSIVEFKFIQSVNTSDFGEIAIFNDNISLIAYLEKPYGFIITSKQVANTARAMFNGFWNSLPKK